MGAESSSMIFPDVSGGGKRTKIIVYNPNSSKAMTEAMRSVCHAQFNQKAHNVSLLIHNPIIN